MHPNRLGAFTLSGAAARLWDPYDIVFPKPPAALARASRRSSLLRALRRTLAALRRGLDRPPPGSGGPPPRTQSSDGHWEDPLLWLLMIH